MVQITFLFLVAATKQKIKKKTFNVYNE